MKIFDYTHKELVEMCVQSNLIDRPVILRKGRGWIVYDKLWRKRDLWEMLRGLEE